MKGCHNCEFAGKIKDMNYKDSPCASCRAKKDPSPLGATEYENIAYAEEYAIHPAYDFDHKQKDEILAALGSCVFMLVEMKEKHPETFKYVMTKIQAPGLSYADIAKKYCCKKQNVQYHLRKAMKLCPSLEQAFLIDCRYNHA
jgi:hypothetical protein